ncbi:ATP-dependent nuclease [[Clostridium] fimetarium]|uniref:Putative ATP-dependent endonuclease of the OLD family n=1 Tax=[Clostridium] fimetarium TaxID=99656 RepID=A0A1I0Q0U3_9FIRM|nr:AAA family ATPase [[Clostridium] fimetarium]SEW20480.1 putative ATP-dependent endonuclease of the OLD family [[Clostridium] fimetarium]
MLFKRIWIKNFRNFESIDINLENKNILFGLNDIGKTNFLYAIRFLFDRECRKNGLIESDFFQKKIEREIEITIEIDISDINDSDNKKIRKRMAGAISSGYDSVFMQLKAKYESGSIVAMPELFWGSDINYLEAIPSTQAIFEIDKIFNVVYIDSSIQLGNVFKRYTRNIFSKDSGMTESERGVVKRLIDTLNDKLGKLDSIKELEGMIKSEYFKYRPEKGFEINIKSEMELENISSKLMPYINYGGDVSYPTSGDGRRKLLAYTLLSLENRQYEDVKINIFLIEELENHLHRSMQLAVSKQLFTDEIFQYMFLTTHSSLIVSSMDEVNLIKLYKTDKTDGKSVYYKVPPKYQKLKAQLNQNLAEAIYADYVLLVEGPSEKILFETIMCTKCPAYELLGGYILEVNGISFKEYIKILSKLNVITIIKTDNDLKYNKDKKEYNHLGLNRALSIADENKVNNVLYNPTQFEIDKMGIQTQIYNNYIEKLELLQQKHIYLSKIDLENDLYEAIPSKMDSFVKKKNTTKSAVDYLQEKKMIRMIELCSELNSSVTINKIYNHDRFKCIKEMCDLCCR